MSTLSISGKQTFLSEAKKTFFQHKPLHYIWTSWTPSVCLTYIVLYPVITGYVNNVPLYV